ncbi:MAG: caspase family protein [Rhodomicrobium sp.]
MTIQRNGSARALFGSLIALLLTAKASLAADCTSSETAPKISVQMPAQAPVRAGDPVEIRWTSEAHRSEDCRYPLYLVFTTSARVRFEGDGFLAMPAGGEGPYGIDEKLDRTRVFIPLHALPEVASGSFKVKFYSAGANAVSWFVTGLSADFRDPERRASKVLAAAGEPLRVAVGNGKPAIVVRDSFAPDIATAGAKIEHPRKKIVSNSNEFELQVYDKFYRVYDIRSGELVIERAGRNPNFSPSSRFIGAFADGPGFEITDLYSDSVAVMSGALGGYAGKAHLAAWSRSDALVALSFWGYGGVYVQQTLVDGPGLGDGTASCHACQGIGTALTVNYDTGIVAWSGQEQGWASLFDRTAGSQQAKALAGKEVPDTAEDLSGFERRQTIEEKSSLEQLTEFGSKYFFDAAALLKGLPKDQDVTNYDGKAWHLGDEIRLSHVCTQDAADNCSSLGVESAEGRAALMALAQHRVEHRGYKRDSRPAAQFADARLVTARAVLSSPGSNRDRNIWRRLEQLGAPVRDADRVEVPVETFTWRVAFDKPKLIVDKVAAKIPSARQIMVIPSGSFTELPEEVDGQHELQKINPKRVRQIANWKIGKLEYWLIQEDYQTGNLATPTDQYLHIVSGNASGLLRIIDLSTRLAADGTLARATDQESELAHLWPSDVDIVTVSADRYLLASGHWLHGRDRWGLVYDLKRDKTLFFKGALPEGTTTKSLSITDNGRLFVAANSNGQVYFYNINSGEQVLTGNYVDDELVIYDANGYYMSTYEGSQFVFLKFPGLPGYLSFKQFAKVLQRPDIIKGIFYGTEAAAKPDLSPPPRLTLSAQAAAGEPGTLRISISATSLRELAKLRLYLDGQLWNERTIGGRELRSDENAVIPAQTRWLTAVAADDSGSESVPVTAEIPRDNRPSNRKLYLLAAGTNTYSDLPPNRQLRFAVADAKSFVSAVKAQNSGYYKSIEAIPFLDAPGLKTELPKTLRSMALSARQDDTIMLFVSGHGYRAPNNKLYLVLGDSKRGRLEETSLSWDDLAHAFEGTRARIVVFIDACHSGAVPDGGSNDEIADALSAQQVRFTVLAAAKGRQESFERDALGGGVFTSAIVKAITGNRAALDTNNNGVIELSELYSKIKPLVLTEMHGKQTPWLARADMVGEVPLF